MKNNVPGRLLLVIAIVSWFLIYKAHKAAYDADYAFAIAGLLLSTVGSIVSIRHLVKRKSYPDKKIIFISIAFLLSSSPVTIWFFIKIYADITGGFFNL